MRLYLAASDGPGAKFGMYSDSNTVFPSGVDEDSYVAAHGKNCGAAYFAVDGVVIIEHWFAPEYPSTELAGKFVKRTSRHKMRKLKTQEIWPTQDGLQNWPRRRLSHRKTEAARLSLLHALRRLRVHAIRTTPPQ